MKLIVGLGNPGEKYKENRHNVGFMFINYLVDQLQQVKTGCDKFKEDKYLLSEICTLPTTNDQLPATTQYILAKPTTFMNKSGEAVKKLVQKYLATNPPIANPHSPVANNLIIIHDDLDIPLGKFRIVNGYGPKLHNGLESIQNHLHTMDFLRIRIGVDNRTPENRIPGIDYVLQNFTTEEQNNFESLFPRIFEQMKLQKIFNP